MSHPAVPTPADLGDADVLRQAADELDAQWRADAERGLRDSFGGCEYERASIAPRLRNMADKIDSPSRAAAA